MHISKTANLVRRRFLLYADRRDLLVPSDHAGRQGRLGRRQNHHDLHRNHRDLRRIHQDATNYPVRRAFRRSHQVRDFPADLEILRVNPRARREPG
jgi:hypothetical protein